MLGTAAIVLSVPWGWTSFFLALLVVGIFVQTALTTVRGYVVTRDAILVQRLLWSTPIDRKGLREARVDGEAFRKARRTFGNGGAFSYSGRFRSKKLGPFRAFVTDRKKTVVLDHGDKKIVVSPDDPERFVAALSRQ